MRQQPRRMDQSHPSCHRNRHGCHGPISPAGRLSVKSCRVETVVRGMMKDQDPASSQVAGKPGGEWHTPRTHLSACETCLRGLAQPGRECAFRATRPLLCACRRVIFSVICPLLMPSLLVCSTPLTAAGSPCHPIRLLTHTYMTLDWPHLRTGN